MNRENDDQLHGKRYCVPVKLNNEQARLYVTDTVDGKMQMYLNGDRIEAETADIRRLMEVFQK